MSEPEWLTAAFSDAGRSFSALGKALFAVWKARVTRDADLVVEGIL